MTVSYLTLYFGSCRLNLLIEYVKVRVIMHLKQKISLFFQSTNGFFIMQMFARYKVSGSDRCPIYYTVLCSPLGKHCLNVEILKGFFVKVCIVLVYVHQTYFPDIQRSKYTFHYLRFYLNVINIIMNPSSILNAPHIALPDSSMQS